MKNIYLMMLLVIVALTSLVSCDRNSVADNVLGPEEIGPEDFTGNDGSYYCLDAGTPELSKDPTKNPENGDKVWIIAGKGFFQDPQNGNAAVSLFPNDTVDKILLGTISSTTPFSGMSAKVLIRPIPEDDASVNRVRFALEKTNGHWDVLWSIPVLKKYNASGNVIETNYCTGMLLSESPVGVFPSNRPKVNIACYTFGKNYAGDFFTRGIPQSQFVEKIAFFDGISGYTANGTSLVALTPAQIPDFSEPCNSDMNCKIKWSGSQFCQQDMNWNSTFNRWETTVRLHPNQVFNFTIYSASDPGTPKIFGVNVGEAECMNVFSYYGEFLTTAQSVNGIVQNIEPVDLRGEWAGVGPQ